MDFIAGIDWAAPAVLASLLAALIATLGLFSVWRSEEWAVRNSTYLAAFAAGVLLTTAVFLMPEGFKTTPLAPLLILLGYSLLYLINSIMTTGGDHQSAGALVSLMAIGFHSYIDGFEYGILFDHNIFLGIMASLGLVTHEFAEGVLLYVLLRLSKVPSSLALILAFVGAAVTTPLGAVTSQFVLVMVDPEMTGMLLSVAAGALLYVGATHLTEHMREGRRGSTIGAYALGMIFALGFNALNVADEGVRMDHQTIESTLPISPR